MSDLKEKVVAIVEGAAAWLIDGPTREDMTDALCALFELSAVERERKAFVAGVMEGAAEFHGHADRYLVEQEAARRYPLPKEETI